MCLTVLVWVSVCMHTRAVVVRFWRFFYRMLVHRSYFLWRRLGGAPVRVFKLVGGGGGQGTLRNRQHVRKILS